MKELVTAKRLGHKTDLKWLTIVNGKIVSAIKSDGKEFKIHEIGELIHSYDPVAPTSMFKQYFSQKQLNYRKKDVNTMKEPRSKKQQPAPKPKQERPKIPNKTTQKSINDLNNGKGERVESINDLMNETQYKGSPEIFSDTVETTLVLEIYKLNGELFYSIEFEDEEDFSYHLRKKKEKYPNYKFVRKTVRSMVSYVEL